MRIGLQIPKFTYGEGTIRETLKTIARTAEGGGFASLWLMDHFFQIEYVGPPEMEMLESYSTLGYLAAVTERVALGALVTGVVYRHPGILVKTMTTVDVLSGGRSYFGVGAGWFEREARGLGVPFPETKVRFEQLEETLRIAHQMWSDDVGPFEGKHYRLAETLCVPRPLGRPHPPILIGGFGEQKTLRLVARYGDACNLFLHLGWDVIRHKLEVLRRHSEEVGRDYAEIEKTTLGTITPEMTTDEILALCRTGEEVGIQHMIFNFPDAHEIAPLERFARNVIPKAREMGP
jgi:F420-dependent oxidoreductase-like protein